MAKKKSPWHGKGKNRWRYVRLKKPPPGSYDIGLDQSVAASRRGLSDLVKDIAPYRPGSKTPAGTQSLRALFDVGLQRKESALQQGYVNQDYATGVALANREAERQQEDIRYQRDTLGRNYSQLANTQRQNFQAAGLAEGGAAEQAALKRASNYAFEVKPLDQAAARTEQDRKTSLSDLLQQQQRSTTQLNSQLGEVNLSYGRGVQDRATELTRARREMNQFARDTAAVKMQQYTSGGGRTRRRVGVKQYRKWKRRGVI